MPPLKYEAQLSKFDCCPPSGSKGKEGKFIRFVQKDLNDPDNYKPPAMLSPARRPDRGFGCIDYALSLFSSEEGAAARYSHLINKHRNLVKQLGTHLATIELKSTDGIMEPSKGSHRNLHEFMGVNLRPRTTLLRVAPVPNAL